MDSKDQLDLRVWKEIRWSCFVSQEMQHPEATCGEAITALNLYLAVPVSPHHVLFQGSRGAAGQEGVAGLDGEEVD